MNWIVNRFGQVPIGEASIVEAVSAAHRKQVFEATAEIMDLIKQEVHIWKKEAFEEVTRPRRSGQNIHRLFLI